MLNRFVYWFWFGLGLSLLPIAISCWIINALNPEQSFVYNLSQTISKGELLIVCCAILGVNIGDLFRDETLEKWKPFKFSLVGASIIIALFTVSIYIAIATSKEKLSSSLITQTSFVLLLTTMIICICSLFLPKYRK